MSIKFLALGGGGVFWIWGGGGSGDFIFMGTGIFLTHLQEHPALQAQTSLENCLVLSTPKFGTRLRAPALKTENLSIKTSIVLVTLASVSPKPDPSKPHPCNMPQAKRKLHCSFRSAALQELHCNIVFSAMRKSFGPKAALQQTKNCTATSKKLRCRKVALSCRFPAAFKPPRLGTHVSDLLIAHGFTKIVPVLVFPGFSVQRTVLVNPYLRFTKTTDFFTKIPGFKGKGS